MKKYACLALLALNCNAVAGDLGDYAPAANICGKFTTYQPSTGAAFALAGTPAISVYKDNSTTQSTTGVSLTASFDSVTGLNHYCIDTSADGTFYSAGSNFDVVITTGSVDSVSVVGSVVGSFSINKASVLRPTTAGRTLTVSAAGAGDANVTQAGGSAISQSGGLLNTNATQWGGTAVASARPLVDTVLISGDAGAADAIELHYDGTAGVVPGSGIQERGNAQAGAAGSITLRSAASASTDFYVGGTVVIVAGTGAGQSGRSISAYNGTTKVATLASNWATNPDNTSVYEIWGTAAATGGGGGTSDWNADERTAIRAILGVPPSGTTPLDPTAGILATIRDQVADVPTNAELGSALSTADDATLAEIGALNNLSSAQAQSAAAAALAAYDPPTNAEMEARTLPSANYATASALSALAAAAAVIDGIVDNLLIGVNVEKVNNVDICGVGTDNNPWNGC